MLFDHGVRATLRAWPVLPAGTIVGTIVAVLLLAGLGLNIRGIRDRRRHLRRFYRGCDWLIRRPWPGAGGGAILATAALLYVTATGLGMVLAGLSRQAWPTIGIVLGVILHAGFITVVLAGLHRKGADWHAAFGHCPGLRQTGLKAGIGMIAMLPPVFFSLFLAHAILHMVGITPQPQALIEVFSAAGTPMWLRLMITVAAVVTAPLAEELIFRGVLLPMLLNHWPAPAAVLTSSVIFAALHGNLVALLPLTLASMAFSAGYVVTRSIWIPVIMHGLFNALSLALLVILAG